MAEPVRARRLTEEEGRRLQQIVRRGKHESIRVRGAMMVMASAAGTPVPAIARLVAADEDTVRDVIHAFNEVGWPRCPLAEALTDPITGQIHRIKLVTDNGPAFKCAAFARFIAGRTEFVHIRTRRRSPGQNGVRERAFGSLTYEHLYRLEIDDLPALAREAEAYRQIFNHIRPHQTVGGHRPIEIYRNPGLHPQLSDHNS
jgi:transposase InsO family protein